MSGPEFFHSVCMSSCDNTSAADLKQANIFFLMKQNGDLFEKLAVSERSHADLERRQDEILAELSELNNKIENSRRECHSLQIKALSLQERLSEKEVWSLKSIYD